MILPKWIQYLKINELMKLKFFLNICPPVEIHSNFFVSIKYFRNKNIHHARRMISDRVKQHKYNIIKKKKIIQKILSWAAHDTISGALN